MHIEPGLVDSSKIVLSYLTAGAVSIYVIKEISKDVISRGALSLALRMFISTVMVFSFFQIMPHFSAGVSEVHFIFGSTLFLLFGAAPAAFGMAAGLFLQGVFFEPIDLPQFGMNVTTLIAPLLLVSSLANKIVSPKTAYVDLTYKQTFALSSVYQAGIVSWVSFWVILGQGMSMAAVSSLATFASGYIAVIIAEPLVDAAILNTAKTLKKYHSVFSNRLFKNA